MKKYKKVKREIDEPEQISHASQHKLALSVGESIVIVDTKDIIFAGTEDGHVNVKTFDVSYSVNDTLVVIEKSCRNLIFSASIEALSLILSTSKRYSHGLIPPII